MGYNHKQTVRTWGQSQTDRQDLGTHSQTHSGREDTLQDSHDVGTDGRGDTQTLRTHRQDEGTDRKSGRGDTQTGRVSPCVHRCSQITQTGRGDRLPARQSGHTHRQDVESTDSQDTQRRRGDTLTASQSGLEDTLTETVRTLGHTQTDSQDVGTDSQKQSGHEDTLTDIKSGRGDILTASQSGLGDTLTNRESRHGDTLTARHWRKTQVCFSFPGPPNFFMSLQKLQSPHSVLMQASQRLHLARGGDTQHCYNTLKCLDTVLKCFFKASPFITKPSL